MDRVNRDEASSAPAKKGFRVGPENLPDGPWRRKITKIKKGLITKAKVKKQYAKVKAHHQHEVQQGPSTSHHDVGDDAESESRSMHPDRQALLDENGSRRQDGRAQELSTQPTRQSLAGADDDERDEEDGAHDETEDVGAKMGHDEVHYGPDASEAHPQRQKPRLPRYLAKAQQEGDRRKLAAAQQEAERMRRQKERQAKLDQRERFRRSMAKARRPGKDGRPKLGRESRLLLAKVQRSLE